MNRRFFLRSSILTVAGATLVGRLAQAANGKIGDMTAAEWDKTNKAAGDKVDAIKPTSSALSAADQALMMEVAMGGMMQLEVSRVAMQKTADADVRAYAKAEVDEQTHLGAKLKEIAAAKKVTLPSEPDDMTQKMVAMLSGLAGAELDRTYLTEAGVKGHEKLQMVMNKVESQAADATLKTVAMTALPVIKLHLKTAKEEIMQMGGKKAS